MELHAGHHANRFLQGRHRAVMEVRACLRRVAQAGHLEDVTVRLHMRDVEASAVDVSAPGRKPVILDDAESLEGASAHPGAVVTAAAPDVQKPPQAGLLGAR